MTQQQPIEQHMQQRIHTAEAELSQLEQEALRLRRELEAVENQGAQASALRGELQQTDERIDQQRQQLDELRAESQGGLLTAQPPEHEPLTGERGIVVGGIAWVAQEGGVSTHLRTHPHFERGEDKARLSSGMQCTIVDGPEHEAGHTWWRVRTTDGQEGWLPDEGLMGQSTA